MVTQDRYSNVYGNVGLFKYMVTQDFVQIHLTWDCHSNTYMVTREAKWILTEVPLYVITYPHRRGIRFVFDLASEKWCAPIISKCVPLRKLVRIAPYLEKRGTLDAPSNFHTLPFV